jgi:hypothetical protein
MSTVGCERIGGVAEHLSVVESVGSACRRAVGTRPRQVLTGVALTCALLALVAVSAGAAPEEQMFLATSAISQGILSIFVPFYGVLLISDLRRHQASDGLAWWSSFLAAELFAVVAAVYGLVISAVAVAVVVGAGSTAGVRSLALGRARRDGKPDHATARCVGRYGLPPLAPATHRG